MKTSFNRLTYKKHPAFTVQEMLVVLILSSILVLLVVSALNITNSYVSRITDNSEKVEKMVLVDKMLSTDFNRYSFFCNEQTGKIIGVSYSDTVSFSIEAESFLIKNTDTIQVNIIEKKLFLKGDLVTSGPIDALEIKLGDNDTYSTFFYYNIADAKFNLKIQNQIN